jgi:hypothetical protein
MTARLRAGALPRMVPDGDGDGLGQGRSRRMLRQKFWWKLSWAA